MVFKRSSGFLRAVTECMCELMQRIFIGVRVVLETTARCNCDWFKRHFRDFLKRNPECFCRSTSMLFVRLLRFLKVSDSGIQP